jgi:hypothetical protein
MGLSPGALCGVRNLAHEQGVPLIARPIKSRHGFLPINTRLGPVEHRGRIWGGITVTVNE